MKWRHPVKSSKFLVFQIDLLYITCCLKYNSVKAKPLFFIDLTHECEKINIGVEITQADHHP